jgi:RNA polymerase sigma-70 factor (ECF subfamily)
MQALCPCEVDAGAVSNLLRSRGISRDGVDIALCQPAGEDIAITANAETDSDLERGLVRRAQEGDATAFEQLYRANVRRIYALCYRLAGEATLAEELAQDVFVKAWQKLASFRGESAFSSWLYPIAVNVALSERRSRRRRTARITSTDDLTPFDKPRRAAGPESGFDLERALALLPEGARAVFVLHDVEGYRHAEIGRLTGVATGTSKAQLHRARKLLREALGR